MSTQLNVKTSDTLTIRVVENGFILTVTDQPYMMGRTWVARSVDELNEVIREIYLGPKEAQP